FSAVVRYSVRHQFVDRAPVGHENTFIMPFAAQKAAKERLIARSRYAAECVEGGHVAGCAGAGRRFERGKIRFAKGSFRDVGAGVITPALSRAISAEVLRSGHDRVGRGEVGSLETAHLGGRHSGAEERVLPCTL